MIWFDDNNTRWMSKLGYYVYFIFGTNENSTLNEEHNININDVVHIGVGKDDFALRHMDGTLFSECENNHIIKAHKSVLHLETIKERLNAGQSLTLRILAHNLHFESAAQIQQLCSEFLYEFKFFSCWTKKQSHYYFERLYFNESPKPINAFKCSDLKGFYLYTLNDNQQNGHIVHVGIGKGDFVWKHVNGAVSKQDYDQFWDPWECRNINVYEYEEFIWRYEQYIKELFEENRIELHVIREGLGKNAADLYHKVFRYLYVFYIQSRFQRRKPPYGEKFNWEIGFRTLEEAFWYFYDDKWKEI